MSAERRLRAVPDTPTGISRHEPDQSSAQRLEELFVMASKGSAQAFEGVYAVMARPVYALALRVVRDRQLAEDITQEASVEVWRKAPTFDANRGSVKSWILTIAHRRAIDRVRREQTQRDRLAAQAPEDEAVVGEQETIVDAMETQWQSAQVRHAVTRLSDKQREAIELAYFKGLTQQQVSEQLEVPLGTAKTRLRDALIQLRGALEVTA